MQHQQQEKNNSSVALDHVQKPQSSSASLVKEEAKDNGQNNLATAASTVEKEDLNRNSNEDELDEEERNLEELRTRRNQLQGMVDENDFDMDELRMLGVHMDGDGEEQTAAAAFERIFDDDLAAEESKQALMRHHKTAQLFAASSGFKPSNSIPKSLNKSSAEGTMECKDESLDDMLTEQRLHMEKTGAIKGKKNHDGAPKQLGGDVPAPVLSGKASTASALYSSSPFDPFTTPLAENNLDGAPSLFQRGKSHGQSSIDSAKQNNKRKYVLSGKYKKTYSSSELFQQQQAQAYASTGTDNFPSGQSGTTPREASVYKREVEMDLMLPFRVRRIEKNNNNGEKKQAKLEIRKRMINERVKQRQRYISMKKIEAIKELIAKGELTEDALRWKVRRPRTASEEAKIKSEIKDEDGELALMPERKPRPPGVYLVKKNGQPRAMPCRWSHGEHKAFIDILKKDGKQWSYIAETIGTKNEQQCRTRGLVLFNKLKKHCWDKELFDVLAPHGKYSYRDTPREPRAKKTLKLRSKTEDDVKKEVKSECSEDTTSQRDTSMAGSLLDTQGRGKLSIGSAALHREKVKKIKQEYMQKKREKKEAEKIARDQRKQLIMDTKAKLRAERADRVERNRLLKKASKSVGSGGGVIRKRRFKERDGPASKANDAEAQRQILLQQRRKITKGKCLVIGKSLVKADIERAKAVSKRDSVYDPCTKQRSRPQQQQASSSSTNQEQQKRPRGRPVQQLNKPKSKKPESADPLEEASERDEDEESSTEDEEIASDYEKEDEGKKVDGDKSVSGRPRRAVAMKQQQQSVPEKQAAPQQQIPLRKREEKALAKDKQLKQINDVKSELERKKEMLRALKQKQLERQEKLKRDQEEAAKKQALQKKASTTTGSSGSSSLKNSIQSMVSASSGRPQRTAKAVAAVKIEKQSAEKQSSGNNTAAVKTSSTSKPSPAVSTSRTRRSPSPAESASTEKQQQQTKKLTPMTKRQQAMAQNKSKTTVQQKEVTA